MGPRKFALSHKKYYSRSSKGVAKQKVSWSTLYTSIKDADLGEWSFVRTPPAGTIRLCKFDATTNLTTATMTIDVVYPSLKWTLQMCGKAVPATITEGLPVHINSASDIMIVLQFINNLHACSGINDEKFVPLMKSRKNFYSQQGKVTINMHTFKK